MGYDKVIRLDESHNNDYSAITVYSKGDTCVINRYTYVSTSDNNLGNYPILGIHWDQVR